jgi:tetratricopeptide (TPR) repeat protein
LFFRHNVKQAGKIKRSIAQRNTSKIKDIKDPEYKDFINALKQGLAKNWQEEKQIREYLWRDLNKNVRRGGNYFKGNEQKIWKDNCIALLPLTEKAYKEILLKKNSKKYSGEDRENCLVMIAELNRNLDNFDKCMEIIKQLNSEWDWLKEQFAWECEAKNPFAFQLIGKEAMNLDKTRKPSRNKPAAGFGDAYFERGKIFCKRGYVKKALADFNMAEKLGVRDYERCDLFLERGVLYLQKFNDNDKALADFTKALDFVEYDRQREEALSGRSSAYQNKGDSAAALADITAVIDSNDRNSNYFNTRSKIHEAMGNSEAAKWDSFKAELTEQFYSFEYCKFNKIKPSFFDTEEHYDVLQNAEDELMFCIRERNGDPIEPEIFYSGGNNALLRRSPWQYSMLDEVHKDAREALSKSDEVLVAEFLLRGENDTPDLQRNKKREYMVKVRHVVEPLDSFESILKDGYPFFTGLRAHLYAHKDKPIRELIGKEDWSTLACILAREEDYEQLERYAAEGIPLDETTPAHFRPFEPSPFYYITLNQIWGLMKDPAKMLRWLSDHGADPDKNAADNDTPLGNQCCLNGNHGIMKALLEVGADPNKQFYRDHARHLPLALLAPVADYDPSSPAANAKSNKQYASFTKEEIENVKRLAALLREYGAKETCEESGRDNNGLAEM